MGAFSLPTQFPAQRDPSALRNPYLDELDAAATNAHAQLSPGAQEALKRAGAPVPQAAPAAPSPQITNPKPMPSSALAQPQDASVPPAGTGITPARIAPPQPQPVPASPEETAAGKEVNRIATSGSGLHQIKNPYARIPLQILGALGETFAPRFAAAIPGTESHHQLVLGEAENALKQQQGIRKAEEEAGTAAATQGHLGAQTRLAEAQANAAEEESKKNTMDVGPGHGVWNLREHRWDVEPTSIDGKNVTEVDAEFGKLAHVIPTKDGRYLIPNTVLGDLVKPKTTNAEDTPLTEAEIAQANKQLADRYAVLNKGPVPPEFQIGPGTTPRKLASTHQALQQLEAAGQSNLAHQDAMAMARLNFNATEANRRNEDFIRAYDRLHTNFKADLDPVSQQLDAVQEARRLVNAGAVGQALGTIKTIVAVAGGKGSNVRVTGAELNSIPAARGLPGGFDTLVNNIMGSGKLTGETQRQIDAVLAQVEEVASRKQNLVNGAMDRAASARSPEELRKIEADYRHQAQAATQAASTGGGGHVIEINGKRMQYKGSGDTADIKNYQEVRR